MNNEHLSSEAIFLVKYAHYENNNWEVRCIVFNKEDENEKLSKTKI